MPHRLLTLLLVTFLVIGCSNLEPVAEYPTRQEGDDSATIYNDARESIFGEGGLELFKDKPTQGGGAGIGVNAYLWRASLDTVSFMPLASTDPFGGTILTDWYEPDIEKGERLKVNVIILGTALRSDGVRVSTFRQVKKNGVWRDAPVDPATATQLEDTILTRARQLRVAQTGR